MISKICNLILESVPFADSFVDSFPGLALLFITCGMFIMFPWNIIIRFVSFLWSFIKRVRSKYTK